MKVSSYAIQSSSAAMHEYLRLEPPAGHTQNTNMPAYVQQPATYKSELATFWGLLYLLN